MPGNSKAKQMRTAHIPDALLEELAGTPTENQMLNKSQFTLTNGQTGTESKIASYQPTVPLAFRENVPARMVFTTVEEFTTDTTGGDAETFNLSHNIIQTPNTQNLVLYDSGNVVQPDSVDYAANTFTYTNPDASADTLHAHYVPRDPVPVTVEKTAPGSQGSVSEAVLDVVSSTLHEQNQNKEPPTFEFRKSPLQGIVPPRWTIDVYQNGSVPFEWDDGSETNSAGTTATNAVLSLPVKRASESIDGLGQAVKRDIIER